MPAGRLSLKTYVILVCLVWGFAAIVFGAAWSHMLPPFSPSRSVTACWAFCPLLIWLVLGGLYFGARFSRNRPGTNLLAFTQVGAGVSAILASQLFPLVGKAVAGLSGSGVASPAIPIVVGTITIAVLFVPCFLLSGVLVVSTGLFRGERRSPGGFGQLLPWILLGCAAAVVCMVSLLVPTLGYQRTLLLTAISMAVLGFAGLIHRGGLEPREYEGGELTVSAEGFVRRWFPAVAGWITMSAGVACAVLWSRVLRQVIGDSVYSDALVWSIFLAGTAIGSFLGQRVARRYGAGKSRPGLISAILGLVLMLMLYLVPLLPSIYLTTFKTAGPSFGGMLLAGFGCAVSVIAGPAVVLGLWAPAGLEAAVDGLPRACRRFGTTMAFTALAVLVAFVITRVIPGRGLTLGTTLTVLPWLCLGAGICLIGLSRRSLTFRVLTFVVLMGVGLAATFARPPWNRQATACGVYSRPLDFAAVEDIAGLLAGMEITFYGESSTATTAVVRSPEGMVLKLDGRITASTSDDEVSERLAGHIPMLLHPKPDSVLIVGLSNAVTASTIAAYGVERIVCIEPERSVVKAAELFRFHNRHVLTDARLRIMTGDPRYYLLPDGSYDIIILQPLQMGLASAYDLLTVEFISLIRSRLASGGIVCLRLSLAELSPEAFRSAATAFSYHFPSAYLWWGGTNEVLLTGSMTTGGPVLQLLAEKFTDPKIAEDLARIGMTGPPGILSHYVTGGQSLLELAGATPASSHDRNFAAFEDPRKSFRHDPTGMLMELDSVKHSAIEIVPDATQETPEYTMLHDRLDHCLKARSLYLGSLGSVRSGRLTEAIASLEEAIAICPEDGTLPLQLSHYYILLSRRLASDARIESAVQAARRALERNPLSYRGFYNLASLEQSRQPATAIALLHRATDINPFYVPAFMLRAQIELATGQTEEAASTVGKVLSIEPLNTGAQHLRALTLIERGMVAEGRLILEAILDREPDYIEAVEALAYAAMLEHDLDRAKQLYERVLRHQPDDLAALNNYATVLAERGEFREAIRTWTVALGLDPGNKNIIANIEEARQKMRRP